MGVRESGAVFKSFREADKLEDPTARREAMLDALDGIYSAAMARSRMIDGEPYNDPDCHAAVKCVTTACELLGVEPRKKGAPGTGVKVFEKPRAA